jgi:hypothetical protein
MSSNTEVPSAFNQIENRLREEGFTEEDLKRVCEAQSLTHEQLMNLLRTLDQRGTIGNGPNLPGNIVDI